MVAVGISGATGCIYGIRLLEALRALGQETELILSDWGAETIRLETGYTVEQVKALAKSGEARRTLTFRSPVAGIVTEKKALQGMRFMPGEELYQVADLSSVWVVADVFEQDIGLVQPGATAKVRINAYPDKTFEGKVSYVYPTLNAETRTVPVRVELANLGLLLKPAMFAQVELPVAAKGSVVTVPVSAVIDSGTRQIALVQQGEGRFEPREVKLGARSDTADYSCLKSNIVVIGDINTHDGNWRNIPATDNKASNVPNFRDWHGTVRSFETNASSNYLDGQGVSRTTGNPNGANNSARRLPAVPLPSCGTVSRAKPPIWYTNACAGPVERLTGR